MTKRWRVGTETSQEQISSEFLLRKFLLLREKTPVEAEGDFTNEINTFTACDKQQSWSLKLIKL